MALDPPRNPLARRWLLNLALLVVVAALGLYAWLRPEETLEATKPTLTVVDTDAVRAIEIVRPEEPNVRLERGDGRWRLTTPIEARADSFAIESLLRLLRAPVESPITPAADGIARYGLENPRLTIRFDDTEIRFGEMHPLKDEYYVQHGSAIHLIAARHYAQASAPHANLIDSRLIEPGRKLTGFTFPDFTLKLVDGEWRRQPEIEALSSDRINGFVADWQHARALQVQAYGGRGGVRERIDITAENADGSPTELTIGVLARKPELVLYRADEGLEYHFPEDTAQRLLQLSAPETE